MSATRRALKTKRTRLYTTRGRRVVRLGHDATDEWWRRPLPSTKIDRARRRIDKLRVRGERPGGEHYRALLRACADDVDPDMALETITEMASSGVEPTSDDHDAVLIAHMFRGRAADAEAYLRSLPWDVVAPDHLRRVLWACLFSRRVDDAERLFREFEDSPVPPDDECRLVLLKAFSMGRRAERARSWFSRFVPPGEEARPEFVASLIDAHARPDHHDTLVGLHERLTEAQRRDPDVAAALVHAYAGAGRPERAEELLPGALDVVHGEVEREDLFVSILGGYRALAATGDVDLDEAIARLAALADERQVSVDYF